MYDVRHGILGSVLLKMIDSDVLARNGTVNRFVEYVEIGVDYNEVEHYYTYNKDDDIEGHDDEDNKDDGDNKDDDVEFDGCFVEFYE
ncbi:unnamed protein product [Dovyalis caffra]|uniref:Uncharacterized protein n=1 Tax=Dovyalis caffra TaxID=77055 RepID=A0AAV1RWC4_9ROSI|nr:unnamed protein product [Dovyalis caffra]